MVVGVMLLLMVPGVVWARTYQVLMSMPANTDQLAPLKLLFEEALRQIEEKYGISMEITIPTEGGTLKRDREYDLVFVTVREPLEGYTPLMGVVIFHKKVIRHCLYVRQDSSWKRLEDLRDKVGIVMTAEPTYHSLRNLLDGEPPEVFFKDMQANKGLHSGIFALALGEVDAAYALDIELAELEMTNPAVANKARPLVCAREGFPPPPVWVRDTVSREDARKIRSFFLGMHKNKRMGRYQGIMNLVGLRFIPHDPELDADVLELLATAREKGWPAEHRRWLSYATGRIPGRSSQ